MDTQAEDYNNSTNQPLTSGQWFTGKWNDSLEYGSVSVGVRTDQAGTLQLQHSADGKTVHRTSTFPINANDDFFIGFNTRFRYFRINYQNGPIAQGVFVLQTVLREVAATQTFLKLGTPVGINNIAGTVRAVLFGQKADGSLSFAQMSDLGELKISGGAGGGSGAGVDPVSIKDGTNAAQKLAVDSNGRIGINNLPATQPISGSISVSNLPATQPVSGTVNVANPTANPETGLAKDATLAARLPSALDADGGLKTHVQNFPATQPISGSVSVSNFPASTEIANDVGNPVPVNGTVSVGNFPSTQPVSGPLTDVQLRATPVPVATGLILPGSLDADGGLKVHMQNPVGTVAVSNFPATQPVSLATNTPDVTDRAARLLGHVTIDNASLTVSNGQTQPLTDVQLRATAVPVSLASVPTHAVTGTFWQATQPVSGPLTNTELRASAVPVVVSVATPITFRGRASTFRVLGRAGTTGQNLLTLFNTGTKVIRVKFVGIDVAATVVKAVTVNPPTIRIHKITAAPTGGSALPKVADDSALSSDVGVTLLQDASADGTLAATALAATINAGTMLTQEHAPRLITAAGYEMFDKTAFFDSSETLVRQNQGLCLRLDYSLATQNPATDIWVANIIWTEE